MSSDNCHRKLSRLVASCITAAFLMSAASAGLAQSHNNSGMTSRRRAALAIKSLQRWYNKNTGLYRTAGWWHAANAITTLADYAKVAHSNQFNSVFSNTFVKAQKTYPGFINHYYDDEGWWALAWIDVYDYTHQPRYLKMAESIFTNMTGGWSDTCSGGIWWSKKRAYKNAIANELFFSVAAHLALRARTAEQRYMYASWANREWKWFSNSGMINSHNLVNDGLTDACRNNGRTTWTYNQGVILGALGEFYLVNHKHSLLVMANNIVSAVLSDPILVSSNGILHEPCESTCGNDAPQFKGIFIRNLSALNQVSPHPEYQQFILKNADSIWQGAHPPTYHLGLIWSAPYGSANVSTQSSAIDALVAAMRVSQKRHAHGT